VVYQIVFSVLFAVIAIVPVWLFICSLVPKWRKHFDEWFNYSDVQLVPRDKRLKDIEKELTSIKKRLAKLEAKRRE
jgi:site-specific recombinase